MIDPAVVEYVRRTRAEQGLPPTVTDPKVLNLLAALIGKPVAAERRAS